MKFPPEFLDEIRARLPVSEVAGTRVKLRREGREWRGLSPFSAEKTPSFFVNDQKGFFHDFSSGKHGDAFAFLMETEGLTFPEAVERLAGMAGPADAAAEPSRRGPGEKAGEPDRRHGDGGALLRSQPAAAGRRAKRAAISPIAALGAPVQQRFGLGYASPERFALRDALAAQGVGVEAMIDAGLLVHGEDIAVPYDRFRDRVMFPIHDRAGRVIAFGGRAMEAGAKAKYLNSPETALFHKGALLFNHHRARKAAHDSGAIVVVEGYIDAIAVSEAGFPNVVAPLGTALTPDQCALLWAMAGEPILCFDGDGAGRRAAFRAIETALPLIGAGKSLRFALLPEGQDPDDLIRLSGPAAIAEHLKDARPLADMLFMRETDGERFDTPEQRAALERRLRRSGRQNHRRDAAPPLSGGYEAAPFGLSGRRTRASRAREYRRTTRLRPPARRPVPSAGATHRPCGGALDAAEQVRPQGPPAGPRNHGACDRAQPSGADREPLRGVRSDRICRRGTECVPGRAARGAGGGARLGGRAGRMAERRRAWARLANRSWNWPQRRQSGGACGRKHRPRTPIWSCDKAWPCIDGLAR